MCARETPFPAQSQPVTAQSSPLPHLTSTRLDGNFLRARLVYCSSTADADLFRHPLSSSSSPSSSVYQPSPIGYRRTCPEPDPVETRPNPTLPSPGLPSSTLAAPSTRQPTSDDDQAARLDRLTESFGRRHPLSLPLHQSFLSASPFTDLPTCKFPRRVRRRPPRSSLLAFKTPGPTPPTPTLAQTCSNTSVTRVTAPSFVSRPVPDSTRHGPALLFDSCAPHDE